MMEIINRLKDSELPSKCPKCGRTTAIVTIENPMIYYYDLDLKALRASSKNFHDDYLEIDVRCECCGYQFEVW